MKNTILFIAGMTCLLFSCQTQEQKTEANAIVQSKEVVNKGGYSDLASDDFKEKMLLEDAVVLDVRTPAEIAQGKIVGAMELDFNDASFADKLKELDKNKTYLVYCKSGGRSSKACKMMSEELGFEEVYNLKGGFSSFSKKAK